MMQYTLVALFAIAFLSYFVLWFFPSLVISLISLGVAVGCDFLLSMVMGPKAPKNTMSAAVFGLIVALSYSIGQPAMMATETIPLLGELELNTCICPDFCRRLDCFQEIAGFTRTKIRESRCNHKLSDSRFTVYAHNDIHRQFYSVLNPTDHINSGQTLLIRSHLTHLVVQFTTRWTLRILAHL